MKIFIRKKVGRMDNMGFLCTRIMLVIFIKVHVLILTFESATVPYRSDLFVLERLHIQVVL